MNRCEVQALQRKDLEQRLKEQLYSLVDSRLRDVAMGGGGWKRVVLGGNKERFVRIKSFLYVKKRLLRAVRKAFCKRKAFGLRKRQTFSAHAKFTDKEKLFLSAPRQQLRTAPKLTCSNPFRISLATVSLQYNNSFSKNNGLASALR